MKIYCPGEGEDLISIFRHMILARKGLCTRVYCRINSKRVIFADADSTVETLSKSSIGKRDFNNLKESELKYFLKVTKLLAKREGILKRNPNALRDNDRDFIITEAELRTVLRKLGVTAHFNTRISIYLVHKTRMTRVLI